jgi:structural maintenance of chromosome 1
LILPGVRGRIVDLCKPIQRKYETAVSVVLGRNISSIVVDEEKTAIDCIEYMRTQRAGQATFIPLDTIQVKPINDKYRSFAKGARLAVDVVQYEGAVERAIHHALGSALVCDNMEVARYVCYEKGQEVKGTFAVDVALIRSSKNLAYSCYSGGHDHPQEWSDHRWTQYA